MEPNQDKKSYGALIGSVIIIVILVLGGIYFWMSKQGDMNTDMNTTDMPQSEENTVNTEGDPALIELNELEAQIEAGVNSTDVDVSTVE